MTEYLVRKEVHDEDYEAISEILQQSWAHLNRMGSIGE